MLLISGSDAVMTGSCLAPSCCSLASRDGALSVLSRSRTSAL